jgi:hypothetical protein
MLKTSYITKEVSNVLIFNRKLTAQIIHNFICTKKKNKKELYDEALIDKFKVGVGKCNCANGGSPM